MLYVYYSMSVPELFCVQLSMNGLICTLFTASSFTSNYFLFISLFPLFFTDVILNSVCSLKLLVIYSPKQICWTADHIWIVVCQLIMCMCGQMLSYFNIKIYKVIFYWANYLYFTSSFGGIGPYYLQQGCNIPHATHHLNYQPQWDSVLCTLCKWQQWTSKFIDDRFFYSFRQRSEKITHQVKS